MICEIEKECRTHAAFFYKDVLSYHWIGFKYIKECLLLF